MGKKKSYGFYSNEIFFVGLIVLELIFLVKSVNLGKKGIENLFIEVIAWNFNDFNESLLLPHKIALDFQFEKFIAVFFLS